MKKEESKEKEPEIEEEKPKEEQEKTAETTEEKETEELVEELQKEEEPTEETVKTEEEAPAPAEKEEKPPKEEKAKEEEEEIVEERIYTVPLSRAWIMPANKRAPRAVRILKSFITKHMKVGVQKESEEEEEEEPGKLIISNEVNLRIWSRGIEKPPRKIRVRAAKDKENNVTVYLAEGD